MNISTTQRTCGNEQARRSCGNEVKPHQEQQAPREPSDLVEFGKGAAVGLVPLYGAHRNFWASFGAAKAGDETTGNIAFAGSVANVAGTASLAWGILGGNSTASTIGAALLVGSGLTHGYAQIA